MTSLFDPQPKSDPRYLFARENELNNLVQYIRDNRWVILLGPRRVGKTSISRCAAAKLKNQTIVIDARVDKDIVKGLYSGIVSSTSVNLHGRATFPPIFIRCRLQQNATHPNTRPDAF